MVVASSCSSNQGLADVVDVLFNSKRTFVVVMYNVYSIWCKAVANIIMVICIYKLKPHQYTYIQTQQTGLLYAHPPHPITENLSQRTQVNTLINLNSLSLFVFHLFYEKKKMLKGPVCTISILIMSILQGNLQFDCNTYY